MSGGVLFDVQRFCLDDGPGIRTTLFFKGCPLRCKWCHNPEGMAANPEIGYWAERCVGCGLCAQACPRGCHRISDGAHRFSRRDCDACGRCAAACPKDALRVIGQRRTVPQALEEALRDSPFYGSSGGGVTLSGGEPLFQADFALSVLRAAKREGLPACVETSGYCAAETLLAAAAETELFLYDIKETDAARHLALTGGALAPVLQNLARLSGSGARVILRCPLVPGCNDRDAHAAAIARLANENRCVEGVQIMPYHPLGLGKYPTIDRPVAWNAPAYCPGERARAFLAVMRRDTDVPCSIV